MAIAVLLQLSGGSNDPDPQLSRGVGPYPSFLDAIAPSFLGGLCQLPRWVPSFPGPPASWVQLSRTSHGLVVDLTAIDLNFEHRVAVLLLTDNVHFIF